MNGSCDYLIIGGGVIGLSLGMTLRRTYPQSRILIIEKEDGVAAHASGRNSGVLHAGFYYSADSFKARFTVAGNRALKEFCHANGIPVNECGKLVVAQDEKELATLHELEKRGGRNGSNVTLIDAEAAARIEPNIRTYQKALYSPDTATVDPAEVCQGMKKTLLENGVTLRLRTRYLSHTEETVHTTQGDFSAKRIINCAGLYADKIARDFGFGQPYTMIPFKGLYLKYTKNKTDVRVHVYPVPNLKNPFLGVHYTKTVDGGIKIGPTAIPAFWRENYTMFSHFNLSELAEAAFYEAKLFFTNSFHFRDLAFEEIHKYYRPYFIGLAAKMVQQIDPRGFTEFTPPGIRAQLLDKRTLSLVEDFIIEGDAKSVHILNAVSPALTCSLPFSEFVVQNYLRS